jgi:polyketide synthase PksN
MGVPGSLASIANRVSYVLNLRGPSMTLDTMCSSSLTAIHLACQDLREGRTWMALAGGVNVSIHPSKYLVLSAGQFISSDGHCQSFGEGGGGYIPGEGVGVVVLKRLSDAKRDGDHIYGLIRGSALTHGGKTNGYTVPNPQEQTGVIRRALKEAGADAREVSYIEAHGTGTKLGDPIEIAALSKAFREYTEESGYCLLGSVKSNIGHCESAAGIAGLTKVLLQMKHGEVVPSLHSKQLNPHIDFEKSPFVVNQELCEWKRPVIEGRERRRLAGVSSFGAGGSNAHVLVEEAEQEEIGRVVSERVVLLLSARTKEQLREKARDLLEYVSSRAEEIDLRRMAYTLQVGREAMEERAALVVETVGEVLEKLGRYVGGERGLEGVYEGQVKRGGDAVLLFSADADLRETVEKWLSSRRLTKLAELWTKGLEVEWTKLYGEEKPRRMSLPAYRFARERYWVDVKVGEASGRGLESVLHPLLHRNVSDLSEQRYETTFSGEEYFLLDHRVGVGEGSGEKVLPGVAYLEMARKALELGVGRGECGAGEVLELRNVVWAEPVRVEGSKRVSVSLSGTEGEEVECEVYSEGEGGEEEHFQGRGLFVRGGEREALDVEDLKGRMSRGRMSGDELYEKYRGLGLKYGPTMRVLREVYRGRGEALAWLKVPEGVSGTLGEYVLHPSVLDGALQSALGLLEGEEEVGLRVPYALERLSVWGSCAGEMWSWVRYVGGGDGSGKVVKVDIDVCDASGRVCAELRGLSTREVKRVEGRASSKESGRVMAVPVWRSKGVGAGVVEEGRVYGERQLVLCELPWLSGAGVESLGRRAQVTVLSGGEGENVAARYSEHALSCFELLKGVLERKRRGKALVQVVVGSEGVGVVYGGLWGLLKTVELENPQVVCQLIEVSGELSAEELSKRVEEEEKESGLEPVRYERGLRQVMSWEEVRGGDVRLSWREDGVYLITGGAGGLGLIFARDVLERTREGRVVLTGRSAGEEMGSRLSALEEWGGRVTYRRMELGDAEQVRGVIEGVLREHGKLNGIVHSAGMVSDAFVLKKGREEFLEVLGPKVMGTYNLDEASAGVGLDFFVMFSSMSGVFGNVGQSDYASANGFMDGYARYRNGEVREGRRSGRTVSIEWPLWESGGMGVASGRAEMLELATGMRPMRTGSGVESFHVGLSTGHERLLVAEGDVGRMREVLLGGGRREDAGAGEVAASAEGLPAGEDIEQRTHEYLKRQLSGPLKLSPQRIDARAELEAYGIDSVLAMKMTNQLEKSFGSLPKTLFFEYRTIASLAEYFVRSHRDALLEQLGAIKPRGPETRADALASNQGAMPVARRRKARFVERGPARQAALDVAVVGLAGRYPGARTVREFWANLREGRDCITEIPQERWNLEDYYDADPARRGTAYSKWGGFIADVDKFDPLFFNISPKEAQLIDPQERLFLETAWEVVEDAGYGREALAGRNVGVYVGVMWGHYELFGAETMLRGQPGIPGSSYASIANRVSYFFDLHGPSIALDTMCSSSLTAVHLACEALRRGEVEAAIAGGVNVTIHPLKFLSLSQGRFVSTDGRCRSFGEGGDGYVPGEGVGAVLLKPLHAALRDGDHVYGIIKSTALNHGGKTNGYTVPNPGAQADVVRGALRSAGADPRTVSYVEAHGTGTSLGDPIEIAALAQAFGSPAS